MLHLAMMPAIFSPRATFVARVTLVALCVVALALPAFAMTWVRTPWARGQGREIEQPVPFDHRVHVTGLRIDCRYCHAGAERGRDAGVPSTRDCVPCHQDTWLASDAMAPVRKSLATGHPIPWRRVTQLPDYVYFAHAPHVRKGVGCESCHGRVDQMAIVKQTAPLTMQWCLDCHRDPAPRLRPPELVTMTGYAHPTSGVSAETMARTLAAQSRVRSLVNCTTCHR